MHEGNEFDYSWWDFDELDIVHLPVLRQELENQPRGRARGDVCSDIQGARKILKRTSMAKAKQTEELHLIFFF